MIWMSQPAANSRLSLVLRDTAGHSRRSRPRQLPARVGFGCRASEQDFTREPPAVCAVAELEVVDFCGIRVVVT